MPRFAARHRDRAETALGATGGGCALLLLLQVLLAGCAPVPSRTLAPADPASLCTAYLRTLDEAVHIHEAGDAGARRVPGYPHLRATRFLASFRHEERRAPATAQWLERLRRTDAEARRIEVAALPAGERARLLRQSTTLPGSTHAERIERCGRLLVARDLGDPEHLARVRHLSQVPASYRTWQRVVGLYPILQVFVRGLIEDLHEELAPPFREQAPAPPAGAPWRRYSPPPAQPFDAAGSIRRAAAGNVLAIPEPPPDEVAALLARFAPVWEIEQRTGDDHIGRVVWHAAQGRFAVDTGQPAQYRWLSHTRFGSENLLQLNYLVWFPARTARSATDIYAGPFDGVVWRVTLAGDGTPLAYDSVHACGCYYLLFNTPLTKPRPVAAFDEPVLVPRRLAAPGPGQRLVVRLRAADHYLQQVYVDRTRPADTPYRDLDYRELLSLDVGDGARRSLFAPGGLLSVSARAERWLLWPFGVPSAGAMRRSGTHAIAFLGQRHFDDARLLETLLEPAP